MFAPGIMRRPEDVSYSERGVEEEQGIRWVKGARCYRAEHTFCSDVR